MKKILFMLLLLPVYSQAQFIINFAGTVYGSSGDGGPATDAELTLPQGVTVDHFGNVYISNQDGRVRMVNIAGIINDFAGSGIGGCTYNGDGIPATEATLCGPVGISIDQSGNVYIVDPGNERIRKVSTTGIISTFAGNGSGGFAGDGGPATSAELYHPYAVATDIDNSGNVYISDGSNRVRRVDSSGIITTFAGNGYGFPTTGGFSGDGGPATAAELFGPASIAIGYSNDHTKAIYIADDGNKRIRMVNSLGIISTYAGGGIDSASSGILATAAKFLSPTGLAIDKSGNVYVSDISNQVVQMITPSGFIYTIAGNHIAGSSGDGGPATAAELYSPIGVAIDDNGNVYISDLTNSRIRELIKGPTAVNTLVSSSNEINLNPNPAKNDLEVSAPFRINNIIVFNLLGQQLYTNEYHKEEVKVNVAGLPNGIYYIKINGNEVRRFVKE